MKNLSVRTQLAIAFLAMIVLLVAVSLTGISRMRGLNSEVTFLVEDRVEKLILVDKWSVAALNTTRHMRSTLVVDSEQERRNELDGIVESQKVANAALEKLQGSITSAKGLQVLGVIRQTHDKLAAPEAAFLKAARAGDMAAAKAVMLEQARPLQKQYIEELEKLTELEVKLAKETAHAAEADFNSGLLIISLLAGSAFAISLLLAFTISRNILGQLGGEPGYAAGIAGAIAAGNLDVEVKTASGDKHSLMASLAVMREQLRKAIGAIQESSRDVREAAASLDDSSGQMATSVAYQGESTSAMAAAVEELTVSINHIAENANEALEMSRQAGDASQEGGKIIQSAVSEMGDIARLVADASATIRSLDKSSQEISGVTGMITEVADRTNLLALNAAIEASRAGEGGRGFSVVADEVRKLAERTRELTAQIGATVGQVQSDTKEAVQHMGGVEARVQSGLELANRAGERIESIQSGARQVVVAITEISAALKEQSAASQDVAKNVERVSQMTEENSAAADHSRQSAASLSTMANQLQEIGGAFRL